MHISSISNSHNQNFKQSSYKIFVYIQEEIKDLLSKDHKKKLELKEKPDTGVYVKV